MEFNFEGKQFVIDKRYGHTRVTTDDFTATSHQLEVLHLRAQGLEDYEIGKFFGVSRFTIHNTIRMLFNDNEQKFGSIRSVTYLVAKAHTYGLLNDFSLKFLRDF